MLHSGVSQWIYVVILSDVLQWVLLIVVSQNVTVVLHSAVSHNVILVIHGAVLPTDNSWLREKAEMSVISEKKSNWL